MLFHRGSQPGAQTQTIDFIQKQVTDVITFTDFFQGAQKVIAN